MVDIKKNDGFSALHLTSLNGHCAVAQVLLTTVSGRFDRSVTVGMQDYFLFNYAIVIGVLSYSGVVFVQRIRKQLVKIC